MKKISIIMSVYNSSNFLEESILSILNQTYKNFEFLILNDGSNDDSEKIIKKFLKLDNRIKYFKNKNQGLTKSLNFLIKKSKSNFIARQDADDISCGDRIKKQVTFFNKNKNCVLLGTNGMIIDEKNNFIKYTNLPLDDVAIRKRLMFKNSLIHSSVMIKKDYLKKINLYDNAFVYSQDYDCWCRISKYGKIYNLEENLVKLRMHQNSITNKKISLQNFYAYLAMSKYLRSLGLSNVDIKKKKKIFLFLKGKYLPKKYRIKFDHLSFSEKLNLTKYPIELLKLFFYKQ